MKIGGGGTSSPSSGILVSGYGIRNTKKCARVCGGGGRERVISTLANRFAENSFTFGLEFGKGGRFWTLVGLFMSDFHRIDTLA